MILFEIYVDDNIRRLLYLSNYRFRIIHDDCPTKFNYISEQYLFYALVATMQWHTLNLIYDLEHGKKRSGFRDFGNRSSLELLATEIDSGLRRSRLGV